MNVAKLRPVQALAASLFFKHKRLILCLPRQEGKTELGIRFLHAITSTDSATASLFLAKNKDSGKRATREKFKRLFSEQEFVVNTEVVYLKSRETSVIFMESVDKDPDRIRGGTYSMIHWSEVAFSQIERGFSIMDVYDRIIQPTVRKTGGYVFLESTNNGKNGWYDLWESYKDFGFHRCKIGLDDMVYLGVSSPEEYEEIERTTHPDVFRQEYLCEWVSFQGKVYNEFTHGKHVDPQMEGPKEWQMVLCAIDWGYSPSATAVLFAYVHDKVLNIFDEHYATEELAALTAEEIDIRKQRWNVKHLAAVADHEEDRIEELRKRGIVCSKAKKVDVMGARIEIKEKFYFETIKIHPRCKMLIKDLDSAVWHSKKEGELDEGQCTWGHFDCEAALRYMVREISAFEAPQPDENPFVDSVSQAAYDAKKDAIGDHYGE